VWFCPKLKGERIGTPADIAACATWKTVAVSRYGTRGTVAVTELTCLWYGTWRTGTVRVILVREIGKKAVPAKGLRHRAGHHRPHRHSRRDHHPLRGAVVDRGHVLRCQEHCRRRRSPQPRA